MSAKREPSDKPDLAAMEKGYWQQTEIARAREDAKMEAEFRHRQDGSRGRLVDLYNRKSQLENELQSLVSSITYQEQEQERLVRDYEETRAQLRVQRQNEDLRQQEWFSQAREREAKQGYRPKSNGRQSSNGELPPLAAVRGWTSINGSRRRSRREEDDEPPADPGNLLGSVYHNPVDDSDANSQGMVRNGSFRSPSRAFSAGVSTEDENLSGQARKNGERPLKPKERHSLPTFTSVVRSPAGKPLTPEEAVAAFRSHPPSGRKSLPEAKRASTPIKDEEEVNDGKEITRENLVIKDDGKFITEPPMYAGIPLEKIHEKHEYWDPEWESLVSIIQPQVEKWHERHEHAKQDQTAARHSVFLANRQINRGKQILDFLNNESVNFHPYQFVGKEMMSKFYKTLINYDTMFRLANVHEELKKFDLDITPLDWLRQRIYEVATAQGERFNLSKYIHDLYHDAKLKALREKHGFGNIGRPSGYKLGERDLNKPPKTKTKRDSTGPGSVRKKGRRSIGQVDPDGVPGMDDLQQGFQQPPQEVLEPVTPRLQKRQRLETVPPPPAPEDDDLESLGFTSTDSFSAGRIMHLDYRVYQIKTRALTTSTEVTQYWTWKSDQNMFEHQVLRDVHPRVTWGFYQKPIDFNLKLTDLVEIQYASDSQKVVVVVKDQKRGDILAHFKRERTKRRFLAFAKKKQVKLVKSMSAQIEDAWVQMKSETLPNEESDT
ncbi:hypothetical protein DL768_006514 [Monosporascus sp. mg162]|nr:hypothetical protein DL768_006514 [Monosporascus sp. mg162]